MKSKVLYMTDFGTRLWLGTDHGYCGSTIQGIHQGQVVYASCRDLKDSVELLHLSLYSDLVRLAITGPAYNRGLGCCEQLFPISEQAHTQILAAERRIAEERRIAAEHRAAEQRAAAEQQIAAEQRIAAERRIADEWRITVEGVPEPGQVLKPDPASESRPVPDPYQALPAAARRAAS